MADPARHLTSVPRCRTGAFTPSRRVLAATLSAVLGLGTALPGAALAGEGDSEGEESAPPGALAERGEETDFDPGGAATVLEELPAEPVALPGGDALDTGEGPPVEAPPSEGVDPASPEIEATDEEETSQEEEPSDAEDVEDEESAEPEPEAEPSEEPAPEPSREPELKSEPATVAASPVVGQPLVASASQPEKAMEAEKPSADAGQPPQTAPADEPAPVAATSEESEQLTAPRPEEAAAGDEAQARAGGAEHVVRAGECLWSIAEDRLGPGASDSEIATEVERLWRLNAGRIGTGDRDILPTGIVLQLR